MNGFVRYMLAGLFLLFANVGCGDKPEVPERANSSSDGADEVARTVPEPLPARPRDVSRPEPRTVEAVDDLPEPPVSVPDTKPPIRVAALMKQLNGDIRVGLVDHKEEHHAMVGIGGQFMGYEVVAADVDKGEVVLAYDGRRYVLALEGSSMPEASSAVPTGQQPPAVPGADVPQMSAMRQGVAADPVVPSFEPTPEERRRGIDPNDASTWTSGYRGPGIERASGEPDQYEPTPNEVQRGIDPNEPASWPDDYRGPGIERLAAEAAAREQQGGPDAE